MDFVSIRIITGDVDRLVSFYEEVTALPAKRLSSEFAEIATRSGKLAIASKGTMDRFGAGAAHPADNRSVIVEFKVDDVDQHYERLRRLIGEVVLPPTTQPWGNRSLLFRDPDGHLINLFTPVAATPRA